MSVHLDKKTESRNTEDNLQSKDRTRADSNNTQNE